MLSTTKTCRHWPRGNRCAASVNNTHSLKLISKLTFSCGLLVFANLAVCFADFVAVLLAPLVMPAACFADFVAVLLASLVVSAACFADFVACFADFVAVLLAPLIVPAAAAGMRHNRAAA